MKWPLLILLTLACLACGGMLPGKVIPQKLRTQVKAPEHSVPEQALYLKVLEAKYLKEKRTLNLAIVRGMLVELERKNSQLTLPDSHPDLKELRKDPAFLSLELTIEHLSHRESVKGNSRHSAYL